MKKILLNILLFVSVIILQSCSSSKFSTAEHLFAVSASQNVGASSENVPATELHSIPSALVLAQNPSPEASLTEQKIPLLYNNRPQKKLHQKSRPISVEQALIQPQITVASATATEDEPIEVYPTSGLAITSMILGILSIILMPVIAFFVVPLSILAIIFAGVSLGNISKSKGKLQGKGLAIAGLVMGLVSLVASIALVVLFFLWWF